MASVESGKRLGLLLAAAMFVLVVDTSLMNVSIAYVVRDLDTTVSGVQAAIALEALVSAAFILIGGKVGDLIGRKRPIAEERISEAAGVNSAAGSFGLSFGLAVAGGILLATLSLSFTHLTESSKVIPPAGQERIADKLEHDAQVVSQTQLEEVLEDRKSTRLNSSH